MHDLCMAARAYFNKLGIITVISVVLFFCDVYLCILLISLHVVLKTTCSYM
nr:MAG TPA: hypothetical protein [Caudoviricetes sp.]